VPTAHVKLVPAWYMAGFLRGVQLGKQSDSRGETRGLKTGRMSTSAHPLRGNPVKRVAGIFRHGPCKEWGVCFENVSNQGSSPNERSAIDDLDNTCF
jgi:hypothetical protein